MKTTPIFRHLPLVFWAALFTQGFITAQEVPDTGKILDQVNSAPPIVEEIQTGYSKQQSQYITGAISVVEREQLKIMPSGNAVNQLQGLAAGVSVIGSGQPGETSRIFIRGMATLSGSQPLFIVDGIPVYDISILNPNDVESIVVLKDAGAAAIYGGRAINGVVVINTRKGQEGLHVNYDMFIGTQVPGKGPTGDLLNTQERADLQWLVYKNDGIFDFHPIYGPSDAISPQIPTWAANTDWYREMTDPALIQNHELSLNGGNEHSRYFAGFGFFDQNGILLHTLSKRYSVRFNSEFSFLNDRVKLGENFTMAFNRSNVVKNNSEDSPIQMGPYRSQSIIPVVITDPIASPMHQFVPGEYGGTAIAPRLGNAPNVVADLNRNKDNYSNAMRFAGNAYMDIQILNGLNFRSTFGGTYSTSYGIAYQHATYERAVNISQAFFHERSGYGGDRAWTHTLSLNRSFGKHRVDAVAGYESLKFGMSRNLYGIRAGYFSDAVSFRTLTNGATIVDVGSYFTGHLKLESEFLKTNYAFDDKYMVGFSIRNDKIKLESLAQSEFYYGVSLGWRLGREQLFQNIRWLSDLKIRGSYGKTGNGYANWEFAETLNLGFDSKFFDNHVDLAFDWYSKKSQELLVSYIPPGTSGAPPIYVNSGSMENTGMDIQFAYRNQWGDLGLNVNLTVGTYKNKLTGLIEGVDFIDAGSSRIGSLVRNHNGHSLSSFYGYKVTGLFQGDEEVLGAPIQDGAEPGFFRFANLDSDNTITPDDRTFLGDPHPDFTAGMNMLMTYRNFDLGGLLYWSQGNDIYNWNRWWTDFWPSFEGQKSKDLLYNSWTESNTGATTPKASNTSNFSTNTQSCSYYIEDGSYLRLKSLQLGYNLDKDLISAVKMSSFRIYVQAVNLFTLTKYSGLDPELGGSDYSFGIDYGNYPNVRQFLVGLQVEF